MFSVVNSTTLSLFQKGYPFLLANCPNAIKEFIDNGVMDITKQETLDFVGSLWKEMTQIFSDVYIHNGGDEVINCCPFGICSGAAISNITSC